MWSALWPAGSAFCSTASTMNFRQIPPASMSRLAIITPHFMLAPAPSTTHSADSSLHSPRMRSTTKNYLPRASCRCRSWPLVVPIPMAPALRQKLLLPHSLLHGSTAVRSQPPAMGGERTPAARVRACGSAWRWQWPPRSSAAPGVRDATRHERACPRSTDGDLIANLESDLSAQHVRHLVAVVVNVEIRHRADWRGFLEHHRGLSGLPALHLERGRSARCHVPHWPLTRRHNKALRIHRYFLPCIEIFGIDPARPMSP